ncbi:MAG: GNAT family N-acetyltransferase [Oscillospiraceae bacterium]|nr:GNAT family N-acetyltransferase [Oscillospiraceae bacterium]
MTIEFRPPRRGEEPQLRALFTEAFGDAWFTELFFRLGYSPDRCFLAAEGQVLAALHWFDCDLHGRRCAYVYGIAAFEHCRGRGIGSALIRAAMAHLQKSYEAILLVPAEEGLFGYYERFGFSTVSTICQETVLPGAPLPLRKLSIGEYATLRRALLPTNGVIQEGAALELLEGYADFYATQNTLCAVSGRLVWELLGDKGDAPGILGALGISEATVRTPGGDIPFAMAIGAEAPIYLGLALD